jgi:hypothetical protein
MKKLSYMLFCAAVAMTGYTIHGSLFWSIVDYLFAPIALVKWLIYHEINIHIIQQTFAFLG